MTQPLQPGYGKWPDKEEKKVSSPPSESTPPTSKKKTLCNRCGKEIRWKYSYKDYLEKKKEDPDFKNIPLNPGGTLHTCQTEKKEQKEIELRCPVCNSLFVKKEL